MQNFSALGDTMSFIASGDVPSGRGVIIGNVLGVAIADAANGTTGTALIEGAVRLPKDASADIGQGSPITWSATDHQAIEVAEPGDLIRGAHALEAAGPGADSVVVKLTPGMGFIEAGGSA